MSIGFSDLSRGLVIELDGQPWEIMDYQRHKMQQRAPVTRLKMKNLLNGSVVERTFQQYSTGFTAADVDTRPTQYLYTDGNFYFFMDQETFDQYDLTKEILGDSLAYLKEQAMVDILLYNGRLSALNYRRTLSWKSPKLLRDSGAIQLKVVTSPPHFKLASE